MLERLKALIPRFASVEGQGFVPSELTLAQLDALVEQGYSPQDGVWGVEVGGGITVPYATPALIRCVTLQASLIAQVVTEGGLRVVDEVTGDRADPTRQVRRAMALLTRSPDGRQHAFGFIESVAGDLLSYSNAMVRVVRSGGPEGLPVSLHRQAQVDADTRETEGDYVYLTRDWEDMAGATRPVARRDMAHAYWGSLLPSSGGGYSRSRLAVPVLRLMRSTLRIGKQAEGFVLEYFKSGANLAPYAVISGDAKLSADQRKEAADMLHRRRGRRALVLSKGSQVQALTERAQRSDTLQLRDFEIAEISRIYGVPGTLMNLSGAASNWGTGVAELSRGFVKFGLGPQLSRLLAAFTKALLPPGLRFEYDPFMLTRGDPAALAPLAQAMLGGPNNPAFGTVSEARRTVGMPREPDGPLPVYDPAGAMGGDDEDSRAA